MPVAVDAQLTPSRRRWLTSLIPLAIGTVLLFSIHAHWLAHVLWLSTAWVLFHIYRSDFRFTAIRLDGEVVMLWEGEHCSKWLWQGDGRLSHAFVEWSLVSASAQKYQLRIWRDAVTEPSWRALNMAYRVNCSHARQEKENQLNLFN